MSLDFSADPHFLVLGDMESGKSNLLRLAAEGIVTRYPVSRARLIIIDYRRSLLDAADGVALAPGGAGGQAAGRD